MVNHLILQGILFGQGWVASGRSGLDRIELPGLGSWTSDRLFSQWPYLLWENWGDHDCVGRK